jgi:hypothetical protein
MTYNDFIWKWNNRYCDYDGHFGNQCVDLMRQYCKDVFNVDGYVAISPRGNAKDIFYNFKDNKYFKKVLNTKNNIPKKGDIIFFKTSLLPKWLYGIAGHVAIVDQADLYSMVLFNQNYPTGRYCEFRKFTYKDCIGWLTPNK